MLLKGINKRVIVIKNPESDHIEEAYFILKNQRIFFGAPRENDMVKEANRIITEYNSQQRLLSEKLKSDEQEKKLSEFLEGAKKSAEKNVKDITKKQIEEEEIFGELKKSDAKAPDYDELYRRTGSFSFTGAKRPSLPKGFFAGIGVMSAVILLIRLFELIFR